MKKCDKKLTPCFHKAHMDYLKKSMDKMVTPHKQHKPCKHKGPKR